MPCTSCCGTGRDAKDDREKNCATEFAPAPMRKNVWLRYTEEHQVPSIPNQTILARFVSPLRCDHTQRPNPRVNELSKKDVKKSSASTGRILSRSSPL